LCSLEEGAHRYTGFNSDVAAIAKRALKRGQMLDGEGGFLV